MSAVYLSADRYAALRATMIAAMLAAGDQALRCHSPRPAGVAAHGVDLGESVTLILGLGYDVWPDAVKSD